MTLTEILKSRNVIISGKIKYFNPIGVTDIEDSKLHKICRWINQFELFEVNVYPRFKLAETKKYRKPSILLVPEDQTKWNKELVKRVNKHGIDTAVVQHGYPCHRYGFLPLHATFFFAWKESVQQFIKWGMKPSRIIVYNPEVPKADFINGIEAVLFLIPAMLGGNRHEIY